MIYHTLNNRVSNPVELPPLPFEAQPKRFRSGQSSTVCATPSIQGHSPHPIPPHDSSRFSAPKLTIPTQSEKYLSFSDSPRISRAAVSGPDCVSKDVQPARYRTQAGTPGWRRLYDFRFPPVPKEDSTYKHAKETEYHGDYDGAMRLYLKAIEQNDRPESAIKDYAGLLHMRGRTEEAIQFLESKGGSMKDTPGFKNLMAQLRSFLLSAETNRKDLPKMIYLSTDTEGGMDITLESLPSFFPNHLKITSITFINPIQSLVGSPISRSALIEFASHSAARKALTITKHSSVDCMWGHESLLQHEHIIVADLDRAALVSSGPVVKMRFAVVPTQILRTEWPAQLSHKAPSSCSASNSVSEVQSPLRLPLISRSSNSPPHEESLQNKFRNSLNLEVIDHSPGFVENMDWCLNTPSPIRHIASLL
jgi:hypothetical protein